MINLKNILQGLILIIVTTAVASFALNNSDFTIGQSNATYIVEESEDTDTASESSEAEAAVAATPTVTPIATLAVTPTSTPTTKPTAAPEVTEAASEETTSEETISEEEETLPEYGYVEPIEPSKYMYVQDSVNVRLGPGVSYEKIDRLQTNYIIVVDGQAKNGWYRFIHNGRVAFLSNNYVGEEKVDIEAREAARATAAAQAAMAQSAQAQAVPAPVPQVVVSPAQAAGVIMVGDSRCVQMQEATGGGGVSWVCENGKGYKWLTETAIGRIDPYVGKGTKVVFCLGVNDPGNAGNYAAFVNQKAAEWAFRGARTYFVSCNPVWENPYTTEEQVTTFNATVPGALAGVRWIDTHSVLTATGYKLVDGLHYDADTNIKIFNLILGSL